MKRTRRLFVLQSFAIFGALLLFITSCAGGTRIDNGDDPADPALHAEAVGPPAPADPNKTGRVGIIVATNSRTWAEILDSPAEPGVVVLFVQPDGPAQAAGLQRGDVITEVDGVEAINQERSVVLMRARPEEQRILTVVDQEGTRTVTVQARVPGDVDLYAMYSPLIAANPDDAVLYFLRAQIGDAPFEAAMADADRAIELAPDFVEAINLRAQLLWNRSGAAELEAEQVEELRDRAVRDWNLAQELDPRNTLVLAGLAQAHALRGNAATARRDAERATEIDPSFPAAFNAMAIANVFLGRYDEAAAPARRAIDLNPYNLNYYMTLGTVFMRLDRQQDCERTVQAIIDLVDSVPDRQRLAEVCAA